MDSCLDTTSIFNRASSKRVLILPSGIAGGLVSQPYFEASFGLVKSDGAINESKSADVSSTVVSVMQAGAFFGALGSAPISGRAHLQA